MGHLVADCPLFSMKSFSILSSLLVCSMAAPAPEADPLVLLPAKPYINKGAAAGPAHLAFGDLVSTAKGLRSLALEGFSEDVDQDGFVDPIAPAVVVAPVVTYAGLPYTGLHYGGLPYAGLYAGYHFGLPVVAAAPKAEEPAAVEEA